MRRATIGASLLLAAACCGMARSVAALALDVPGTHPTLQAAVAAAAASLDLENTITISVSPVSTNAAIDIGGAFGPARHLTIRPAAALPRASVVSTNAGAPIFNLSTAGHVTLQDLDILRNITNGHHLVVLSTCEQIVIERCRIGSNWFTTGTQGWANVYMTYPTDITLRNNILFARTAGTFDHGVYALSFNDASNALRLYNNVVADYRVYGIRIQAGVPGSLVLLRNNVVANNASLAPEPVAYRSEVGVPGATVVTSHNVAFASAANVQTGLVGAADLAGLAASFLEFAKPMVVPAFVATTWTMAPPWDANADFFRLAPRGPLHDDAGDYGFIATNNPPDFAVIDDIEREFRPGGAGPHSDRGADQIEAGAASGVASALPSEAGLLASVRASGGGLEFVYETARAGRLELSVFDALGRRVHAAGRSLPEGATGRFAWPGAAAGPAGVLFYRMSLTSADGRTESVAGKAPGGR